MVTGPRDGAAPTMLDRATRLVRVYTRAFLAQGVGVIGLAWCLAQDLPLVAFGLTFLVLADQIVFLRGRPPLPDAPRVQLGLDIWCLVVSGVDVLLLFATLYRSTGLHEPGGAAVADPLSCFAFAVATLARLDLGLRPVDAIGRLVAAVEALLGDAALLGLAAFIVARSVRHR